MWTFKNWTIKGTLKRYEFQNKQQLKQHYQDLLELQKSVNRDLKRIEKVLGEF